MKTIEIMKQNSILRSLFIAVLLPGISFINANAQVSYVQDQWHIENTGQEVGYLSGHDINVVPAWQNVTEGDPNVVVVVVEGDNYQPHVDLDGNILELADFSVIFNPNDPCNLLGTLAEPHHSHHATAVAGVVAANGKVKGIAPDVRLIMLSSSGNSLQRFHAINYAIDKKNQYPQLVITCSWSFFESMYNNPDCITDDGLTLEQYVDQTFQRASDNNIPVIFVSGNGNRDTVQILARDRRTIAVGSMPFCAETRKEKGDCVNTFPIDHGNDYGSNYGEALDISAPGKNILTTDIPGCAGGNTCTPANINNFSDKDYTYFSGTSSAAPQVAGAIALMLSVNPHLTLSEIRDYLFSNADKVNNIGTGGLYDYTHDNTKPGHSLELGYGRLNVLHTLNDVVANTPDDVLCYTLCDPATGLCGPSTLSLLYDIVGIHEITANQNWTGLTKKVKGRIIVKAGNTLNISGSTIFFADSRLTGHFNGIIVERGAKVILDNNTVLTSMTDCGNAMWDGVLVFGNPSASQNFNPFHPNNPQGVLVIKNGSEIKNAHLGALADNPWQSGFAGGMIWALSNSKFINNRIAVQINDNPNANCRFVNCQFINDASLLDAVAYNGQGHDAFVVLNNTKGAFFRGVTYNGASVFDFDKQGTGIRSFNSTYTVGSTNPSYANTFTGLTKGIDAYGDGSLNSAIIQGNVFNNVRQQITLNGANFTEIIGNTFNIPKGEFNPGPIGSGPDFPTWGVYVFNGQGFLITENNFNTILGVAKLTWGVITRNSVGFGGEVYKNDFSGMYIVATQIEQDNSDLLQIGCNQYFDASIFDWALTPGASLADQGSCDPFYNESPPSNQFHPSCIGESQIFVSSTASGFAYAYEQNNIKPVCVTTSKVALTKCPGQNFSYPTSCPSKILTGCTTFGCLKAKLHQEKDPERQRFIEIAMVRLHLNKGNTKLAEIMLENMNTEASKKLLVAQYLREKKFRKCRDKLIEIPANNLENQQFHKLFGTLVDFCEQGREIKEISPAEEIIIREVDSTKTRVSVSAQAILAELQRARYNRFPEKIDTNNINARLMSSAQINENEELFDKTNIKIIPNPFSDHTTIKYQLPSNLSQGEIMIYNLVGDLMERHGINTPNGQLEFPDNKLSPGLYFCKFSGGDQILKVVKLVVTK